MAIFEKRYLLHNHDFYDIHVKISRIFRVVFVAFSTETEAKQLDIDPDLDDGRVGIWNGCHIHHIWMILQTRPKVCHNAIW